MKRNDGKYLTCITVLMFRRDSEKSDPSRAKRSFLFLTSAKLSIKAVREDSYTGVCNVSNRCAVFQAS